MICIWGRSKDQKRVSTDTAGTFLFSLTSTASRTKQINRDMHYSPWLVSCCTSPVLFTIVRNVVAFKVLSWSYIDTQLQEYAVNKIATEIKQNDFMFQNHVEKLYEATRCVRR